MWRPIDQVHELTDRERALADLAVAVSNNPQSIRDGDSDRLKQLGLDDHLILDALSIPPNPEYTGVPAH